jgi:hypothetical protein
MPRTTLLDSIALSSQFVCGLRAADGLTFGAERLGFDFSPTTMLAERGGGAEDWDKWND